ncbi:aquaporin Z [Curtobacterium citreum]|uniref:Aquaporin Z n=1 Tax=Curtobacterium citreum TaxID=2036 RepID=A0ABT2HM79_9MICO|nr:aquaporin Z [Curtobacterium citreum]MCS6524258.1 aquaporin Z [Curtobacterium citreum]TQJ27533.1 aquaporin Z [Curtobacterium citreum]GGL92532.1 aquaporin Z [Curtobacterium citreum]
MARKNTPGAVSASTSEQRREDAATWSPLARYLSECFGTFLLVLGGVGTALFAANFPSDTDNQSGVGFLGVALAFGLTLVAGIAAVGHISGGHFNPAVTLGLLAAGRTDVKHVPGYIVSQVVGGLAATSIIAIVLSGKAGAFSAAHDAGFASNGFGSASPGGYGLGAVFLTEAVLTGVFIAVILSITAKQEYQALAPIGIGLTLTLIHLVSIPISNTSVNPARSIATAVYGGATPLAQLWVFIVAPIVGGIVAGLIVRVGGRRRITS